MSIWIISAGLFFSWFLGALTIVIMARRSIRKSKAHQQFVADLYHRDLMPEICRVEGLLNLALIESRMGTAHAVMYLELAMKSIKQHKQNVTNDIQKHHKYDDHN